MLRNHLVTAFLELGARIRKTTKTRPSRCPTDTTSDDHGREVENRHIIVVTAETPVVIVENRSHRRLPLATTTARRNVDGAPDRDRHQEGPATTTGDPRDGSGRGGEIALITDRDATIE